MREFIDNGERIKAHVAETLEQNKRCMLTFRWFNTTQGTALRYPAFERDYRFIKTIAVSVFNTRERTSWHFGPLRLTFRVLYNLEPVRSPDAYIEVDDRVHRWIDDPLFIFDDTAFHRSTHSGRGSPVRPVHDNVRPNHSRVAFEAGVHTVSVISGSLKRLFYKNWSSSAEGSQAAVTAQHGGAKAGQLLIVWAAPPRATHAARDIPVPCRAATSGMEFASLFLPAAGNRPTTRGARE